MLKRDWIALQPTSYPDGSYIAWRFTGATASGTVMLTVPASATVGQAVTDVRAGCVEEARDQVADAVGLLAADPWTALLAHERHHLGVRRLPARSLSSHTRPARTCSWPGAGRRRSRARCRR